MNALERRVRDGWLRQANVSPLGFRLDELDAPAEVHGWVDAYCRGDLKDGGLGLVLHGSPGHGKTTIAEAVVREVVERADLDVLGFTPEIKVNRPVYFTAYFDYVEMQKRQWQLERFGEHDTDEYYEVSTLLDGVSSTAFRDEGRCRLVVLDDVGKEYHSGSGWAEGEFNALLRKRYRCGYPTIITTNIPPALWKGVYGAAAGSFVHEAYVLAEIVSPDKRDRRLSLRKSL